MTDRDQVIKGLECRKNAEMRCGNPCEETGNCKYATMIRDPSGEPYYPYICDRKKLCEDALALLKEQELDSKYEQARVMSRKEIQKLTGYVWKEYREMKPMKGVFINRGIEQIPYEGDFATKNYGWLTYQKQWRIWTALPTDEQRKAVKWDGTAE